LIFIGTRARTPDFAGIDATAVVCPAACALCADIAPPTHRQDFSCDQSRDPLYATIENQPLAVALTYRLEKNHLSQKERNKKIKHFPKNVHFFAASRNLSVPPTQLWVPRGPKHSAGSVSLTWAHKSKRKGCSLETSNSMEMLPVAS